MAPEITATRHQDLEPLRRHLETLAPREYLATVERVYEAAGLTWGTPDPPPAGAGQEGRQETPWE